AADDEQVGRRLLQDPPRLVEALDQPDDLDARGVLGERRADRLGVDALVERDERFDCVSSHQSPSGTWSPDSTFWSDVELAPIFPPFVGGRRITQISPLSEANARREAPDGEVRNVSAFAP